MSDQSTRPPLIVGVGNPFRSDDGVGPWVAEAVRRIGREARVHAGDGTGLMDLFNEHDDIILVDATRSGASPGTLVRLDPAIGPLRADLFHYSTHRFGLAEAVETARALGRLPAHLLVYGIEGQHFGAGIGLTACVEKTAAILVEQLGRAGATKNGDR